MTTHTTPTVTIAPGQVGVTLDLLNESALSSCAGFGDVNGAPAIVANWPSLSSGETLLWQVLAWLNGAHDCPSRADLEAGLDPRNLRAALHAVAVGSGVTL